MTQLEEMIVTLYTHPMKIDWYKKVGFTSLHTALARFRPHEVSEMIEMKFIDSPS
jgi:hypothetical protein